MSKVVDSYFDETCKYVATWLGSWSNQTVFSLVVTFSILYYRYVDKFEDQETKKRLWHVLFWGISILTPFLKLLDIYLNGLVSSFGFNNLYHSFDVF